MGRFGDPAETPLVSLIFSAPPPPVVNKEPPPHPDLTRTRSFAQFRTIIPRSLSGNMHSQEAPDVTDSS